MWGAVVGAVAVGVLLPCLAQAVCTTHFDCASCDAVGSCSWYSAEVSNSASPAVTKPLYGGFCAASSADAAAIDAYFVKIDPFAKSTGLARNVTELTTCPSGDDTLTDEYVFDSTKRDFAACIGGSGKWCATDIDGDDTTLGGACMKAEANCKKFDTDMTDLNFISKVAAAAVDVPVPCSKETNCGDCEAARASGCSWCGMTINVKTTKLGKCLELTETCDDSTAKTVFPGFEKLFTKQFTDVKLTMGAKAVATADCLAGAVDPLMFSGKTCDACKALTPAANWCSMALYDWASEIVSSSHHWCVQDETNCSPNIVEDQLPNELLPAVKVRDNKLDCSTEASSLPPRCSTHMECGACTKATDSDCQFCVGSTAAIAKPNELKSLYGGFCRAQGMSCAPANDEFDGMRKFAEATNKTVLTAATVAEANCKSLKSVDAKVFNPLLQDITACNGDGGSWCATTFGTEVATEGGACLTEADAATKCSAFNTLTTSIGLVSEIKTPESTTMAPETSTSSAHAAVAAVSPAVVAFLAAAAM